MDYSDGFSPHKRKYADDDISTVSKKIRDGDLSPVNSQEELIPWWEQHLPSISFLDECEDDFSFWQSLPDANDANIGEVDTGSEQTSVQPTESTSPDALSEPTDVQSAPHEICLGLIVVEATSSFEGLKNKEGVSVDISVLGNSLKLHHKESDKYAGLISSPGLRTMLETCHVRLAAKMVRSGNSQSERTPDPKGKSLTKRHSCSLRIVVYASRDEQQKINDILLENDLYFQHPLPSECDPDVEYSNPHYLLRPGAKLPRLEDLSLHDNEDSNSAASALDEVWKNRVMQVFDDAAFLEVLPSREPSPWLEATLNKHQRTALAFMIEKEIGGIEEPVFPQLWRAVSISPLVKKYRHIITGVKRDTPQPLRGGILADEMGLGKTLSMLALVCASLDQASQLEDAECRKDQMQTLVVAPKSVLPNWLLQIDEHIKATKLTRLLYHGSLKSRTVSDLQTADVVLTTYETLRSEWATKGGLFANSWYRVVLDEAHHIRNRASQIFKAACALKSQYRWCLTGTPIMNSIDDYGALLAFLRVIPFESKSQFDHWIASPLKKDGPNCLKVLHNIIQATCLRRTKNILNDYIRLPCCIDRIETVKLDESDRALYEFFRDKTARLARCDVDFAIKLDDPTRQSGHNIVSLLGFLRLICNHGLQLLPSSAAQAWYARDRSQAAQSLNLSTTCNRCSEILNETDVPGSLPSPYSQSQVTVCEACLVQRDTTSPFSNEINTPSPSQRSSVKVKSRTEGANHSAVSPSAKVKAILNNILSAQQDGIDSVHGLPIKSVVYSYWTKMLDLIEPALKSQSLQFARIDGSSTLENRTKAIRQFQTDPKCTVMLASITSAGEGVNLSNANHIHLVEPHWNPMAEAQAVARIHRIGQLRETTVTRYIVEDSIEEYVQMVQKHKLRLISRSLGYDTKSQKEIDEQRWKMLQTFLS